jgi:hypothetical protein
MKRASAIAAGAWVIIILLFFFVVPVVKMDIAPCIPRGTGYVSISYRIFYFGMTHSGARFVWLTQNLAHCR